MFGKKPTTQVSDLLEEVKTQKRLIVGLKKEKMDLYEEVEKLKLRKRIESEEITHLIKINEERTATTLEKEKVKLETEKQQAITKLKDESRLELEESLKKFHSKIESRFSEELKNLKEVYGLIMSRLPNVNYNIDKQIYEGKVPKTVRIGKSK